MAWAAWRQTIASGITEAVGVSCCAALATNRDRKGVDRAHFGWCDGLTCRSWTMLLDKSPGRAGQEELVLGEFNLDAAFVGAGTLGEDIENQAGTIEHQGEQERGNEHGFSRGLHARER